MQPEDIDKLFRDRLQEHAPTPPDYLWDQLEAELQPAKKRPVMWLYAAAAVVALLLVAGSSWLLRGPGSGVGATGSELATTIAGSKKNPVKLPTPQATPAPATASKESEASTEVGPAVASAFPTKPAPVAPDTRSSVRSQAPRRALARTVPSLPSPAANHLKMNTAPVQAVAVVSPTAAQLERPVPPTTTTAALEQPTPSALVTTAVPTGPILVEVRRENSTPGATAYAVGGETGHRGRLSNLLLKAGKKVGTAVLDGRQINLPKVALPEVITAQVEAYATTPRP